MMKRSCLLSLSLLVTALAAFSTETTEAVIARARARLGGEQALDAIKSLHFTGTIETDGESSDAPKPEKAEVDIIFQKPLQHRLTITTSKGVDITGLDGYTAWRQMRVIDEKATQAAATKSGAGDASGPSATAPAPVFATRTIGLGATDLKRLRADAWESISFFRGIEGRGGEAVDLGDVEVDGQTCRKIAFRYGPGIQYIRYFEVSTGRLALTETALAGTIREQGETIIDGVRFPQRIVQTSKGPDGKARVYTITLKTIVLNEAFPSTLFEQPLPALGK